MDRIDPPKPNSGDLIYSVVKAGVSAVPFIGGPAAELMNYIIAPPIEKRREEWMNGISEIILKLQMNNIEFRNEALSSNEVFISSLLKASQKAIQDHRHEKIKYLKNIVVNSVLFTKLNDDIKLEFLEMVDNISGIHVQILSAISSKIKSAPALYSSTDSIIEEVDHSNMYHNLNMYKIDENHFYKCFQDLDRLGILKIDRFQEKVNWGNPNDYGQRPKNKQMIEYKITNYGKNFLNFITNEDYKEL